MISRKTCACIAMVGLFLALPATSVLAGSFTASADVWLREVGPDTTFETDLMSVWNSFGNEAGSRYGVVEFDVSSLAEQSLPGARLRLYGPDHGFSDQNKAIKQTAVSIDTSGGTQTTSMTWNTYQAEYAAGGQALESLGAYDLAAPRRPASSSTATPALQI